MVPMRCAVVDVGTNSVKLLVADVLGRQVEPVLEEAQQTRLGDGMYRTGRLQAEAIARTSAAVAAFARLARAQGAAAVRVFATSAAREAVNAGELVAAIERTSGLRLEILSGSAEAEAAFRGVRTQPGMAGGALVLVEVGGGSTQLIVGGDERVEFRGSFPVGALRFLEEHPIADPPQAGALAAARVWLREFLARQVRPALEPVRARLAPSAAQPPRIVGVGGTATVLARMERQMDDYDRPTIESVRLSRARLGEWVDRLWAEPLSRRRQIVGLPPERADVILPGAAIYEAVLAELGLEPLCFSTRGLRFAMAATCA